MTFRGYFKRSAELHIVPATSTAGARHLGASRDGEERSGWNSAMLFGPWADPANGGHGLRCRCNVCR